MTAHAHLAAIRRALAALPVTDRAEALVAVNALENIVRNPAALATDDELFDAVVTREGDLLLNLGRQLDTDTLRELLAEREAEEAKRETA